MLAHMNYVHDKAKIGNNVIIKAFATVHDGVIIGDDCIIEDGAKIYENCVIGKGTVIGPNAVLRPNTRVGDYSIFGTGSISDGNSFIGNYVTIQVGVLVTGGMYIGDNCFIGPHTTITNTKEITKGRHGTRPDARPQLLKTIIEHDVNVGADCKIAPGITIGHNATIDMDTLVTKDVPPFSHVRGGKDKVGKILATASQ